MSGDLEIRRWVKKAVKQNLGPMQDSAVFLAIFSRNYVDDAYAVLQFGLAVLLDKPIYLTVEKGTKLSENVKRLARGIRYYDRENKASIEIAGKELMELAIGDLESGAK